MNKILTIAIVIFVVFTGILVIQNSRTQDFGGLASGHNIFSGGVIEASTTVATSTATKILSRNLSRQWASMCNLHASSGIAVLHFVDSNTSTLVAFNREGITGMPLAALTADGSNKSQACYKIDSTNLYRGEVWSLFFSSTTGQISTQEK